MSQDDNEGLSSSANPSLSVYGAYIKPKNIIMMPSISQTEVTGKKRVQLVLTSELAG